MKRYGILLTVLMVLGVVSIRIQGDEPKTKEADLMRKKLEHSQKVLEGIAVGNYRMIEDNAEELMTISKKAAFKKFDSPAYEMYGNQFRRSAEGLIESAKAKNNDAAALNYVEMTLSCVKCHKYVRETRRTMRD